MVDIHPLSYDSAQQAATVCAEAIADKAGSFTCAEAEAMIAFLADWNDGAWAENFLIMHIDGDREDDDMHHGWTEDQAVAYVAELRAQRTPT